MQMMMDTLWESRGKGLSGTLRRKGCGSGGNRDIPVKQAVRPGNPPRVAPGVADRHVHHEEEIERWDGLY